MCGWLVVGWLCHTAGVLDRVLDNADEFYTAVQVEAGLDVVPQEVSAEIIRLHNEVRLAARARAVLLVPHGTHSPSHPVPPAPTTR